MRRTYYSMATNGNEASINVYGDITSYPYEDHGDVSAVNLSKKIEELGDVAKIHVYINSYGGEVAEGLAIYNALKRHKAKVITYCDGFAASIASVVFMAGDKRVMSESSLLMVHNAWTFSIGNAEQLRKQADDLDKITQASIEAYKAHSNLSEEEIKALLDAETWILPEEALEYGFATKIEKTENKHASQNVRQSLVALIKGKAKAAEEDEDEDEAEPEAEPAEEPEAEPVPEEEPEDPKDEEPDEDEENPDGDSEEPEENNATHQKWGGLFNAIQKKLKQKGEQKND